MSAQQSGSQSRRLKVFLCHASDDKSAVRELYKRLQQDGFQPWFDEEDLSAGQDWQMKIQAALRNCEAVIVCLSHTSISKEGYVQKEIKFALDEADAKPEGTIFIIPLRLEECTVPARLSRWQWVDAFRQDGYERLLRSLQDRAESHGFDLVRNQGRTSLSGISTQGPEPGYAVLTAICDSIGNRNVNSWSKGSSTGWSNAKQTTLYPGDTILIVATGQCSVPGELEYRFSLQTSNRSSIRQDWSVVAAWKWRVTKHEIGPGTVVTVSVRRPRASYRINDADDYASAIYDIFPQSLAAAKTQLTPSGAIKINPKDGLEYVWIPPGQFLMGASPTDIDADDEEKPQHAVWITNGFWLSKTPVTVGAYKRFSTLVGRLMPEAPNFNRHWHKEDHPMVNVSWEEAEAYCTWSGGRLPTEAEWEYAARGGKSGLKYPWGNEISPEHANYSYPLENRPTWTGKLLETVRAIGRLHTTPVTRFPRQNEWGLYDMAGNVEEYVEDRYDEKYYSSAPLDKPLQDPRGPAEGSFRVLRGGSFLDYASCLRVAARSWSFGGSPSSEVGFCCALHQRPKITL